MPRIYERVYARLQESRLARLRWPLLDLLVGRRLRAQFGGRLRFAITGGAPMALAVAERFRELGVEVLQGYGMTESSPVVAANRPGANDPASVGPPIPGVEVKIGANDELLVKGPNVMAGYLNRPEDTARAIEGGWLHTGDQAEIRDGRIVIKGRIKDIIVTSTGEKIAPADLELALQADPLFAQAIVIGENRPFLAVLAGPGSPPLEKRSDRARPRLLREQLARRPRRAPDGPGPHPQGPCQLPLLRHAARRRG